MKDIKVSESGSGRYVVIMIIHAIVRRYANIGVRYLANTIEKDMQAVRGNEMRMIF